MQSYHVTDLNTENAKMVFNNKFRHYKRKEFDDTKCIWDYKEQLEAEMDEVDRKNKSNRLLTIFNPLYIT